MMPLNLQFPDPANAMLSAGQIENAGLRNQLLSQEVKNYPERWDLTKRQAEHNLTAGKAALELEKLKTLADLLRGVKDQSSYTGAIERYIKMFPDEIGDLKSIPPQYDKKYVDAMIEATTTAAERIAGINYAGRIGAAQIAAASKEPELYDTEEGWLPWQKAEGKKKPDRAAERQLPSDVKLAMDIVKKFSPKSMDPWLASVLETMNPGLVEKLEKQSAQVPENIKPVYNKALAIIKQYAGAYEITATNPQTGEKVGWDAEQGKWIPIK